MKALVQRIYDRLFAACGPRGWWPGEGRDEIIIGAVLTQNTAWRNVEKALANLRAERLVSLARLARLEPEAIAPLIIPAGYFNLKARRLRSVADFFAPGGRERFDELAKWNDERLRGELLGVWGVGPETADSILLYALDRKSFVVDAYTMRVVERHGLMPKGSSYEAVRALFTRWAKADLQHYNEYHALIVWAGHHFCKPTPLCAKCPLRGRDCFATEKARRALKPEKTSRSTGKGKKPR